MTVEQFMIRIQNSPYNKYLVMKAFSDYFIPMKTKILFFLFIMLSGIVHAQNERDIVYYSLFLERDFQGILVLEQKKTGELTGFIKSFGGYLWLERVYGDSAKKSLTFIQERNLENLEGMESFMNEKDIVTPFHYSFRKSDDDQIVDFLSPGANAKINGFLSRGETFSLATLTGEAWYAGTYIPVQNISSLELWAKNNGRTFCQWISSPLARNVLNKELNTQNLRKLMSDKGYSCDKYFNLIK